MDKSFEGKVALVTGASSGIGLATARLLAQRGASVVLAARREEDIATHASALRSEGAQASHIRTDVSDARDVEAMVAHAVESYGRLDIAVNNAGIEGVFAPIIDFDDEDWDAVMRTNLRGCYLCIKHEARAMLAAGNGGAIVSVGSVNSFLGAATGSAYCASKHALVGLTSSVSAELAAQGVRVNLVCPGLVKTPMHQRARDMLGDEPYDNGLIPRVHQQRAGEPDEQAKAIAFLCSDEASYITGTTLTPDGGLLMTM